MHPLQQYGGFSRSGLGTASNSGQSLLQRKSLHLRQGARHPFPHRSTCAQAFWWTHMLRVVTASLPAGESVPFLFISRSTVEGDLPMALPIPEMLYLRMTSHSIVSRSP